jgi:hypothetical protein
MAAMMIPLAARLAMAPFYPEHLKWAGEVSFTSVYNPLSPEELALAGRERRGVVPALAEEVIRERLTPKSYGLIGISCPFQSSIVPAVQLASLFRIVAPKARICLGGAALSCKWRHLSAPDLFDFFDYVILDDGEAPLLELARLVRDGKDEFADIPNMIYRNADGDVVHTDRATMTFIAARSRPDFSDIDFARYAIDPERAGKPTHLRHFIPLRLIHGCYWRRCAFCDTDLPYVRAFETREAEAIVREIFSAVRQTGVRAFHFVDEAAPPALMDELSRRLCAKRPAIEWKTNVRFERYYTREVCDRMYRAGCRCVYGGLEAVDDRLLALMSKGITVEGSADIAANFSAAGIAVQAYLMVGFPTQTVEEALDAGERVRSMINGKIIQSGGWHRFFITTGSDVYRRPERYRVERIGEHPALTLSDAAASWRIGAGMDTAEAESMHEFLTFLMLQWKSGTNRDVPVTAAAYDAFKSRRREGFAATSDGTPARARGGANARASRFDIADINRVLSANPGFRFFEETYAEFDRRERSSGATVGPRRGDARVRRRAKEREA